MFNFYYLAIFVEQNVIHPINMGITQHTIRHSDRLYTEQVKGWYIGKIKYRFLRLRP